MSSFLSSPHPPLPSPQLIISSYSSIKLSSCSLRLIIPYQSHRNSRRADETTEKRAQGKKKRGNQRNKEAKEPSEVVEARERDRERGTER
jgi:hypothetical protein